jgi:hypothetical protein
MVANSESSDITFAASSAGIGAAVAVGGVHFGKVFAPGGGGGGGGGSRSATLGTCASACGTVGEGAGAGAATPIGAGLANGVLGAEGADFVASVFAFGIGPAGDVTTGIAGALTRGVEAGGDAGAAAALFSGSGSTGFFSGSAFAFGFESGCMVGLFAEAEVSEPLAGIFAFAVFDFFATGFGFGFVATLGFSGSGGGGGAGCSFLPRPITPLTRLKNPGFFSSSSAACETVLTWVSIASVRNIACRRKIIPMSASAPRKHSCIPKLHCIQVLSQAGRAQRDSH